MSKCVSHVLFDMDGLILDTEPLYTDATLQVAKKYGSRTEFTWDLKDGPSQLDSERDVLAYYT